MSEVQSSDPDSEIPKGATYTTTFSRDELHLLGGLRAGTADGHLIILPTRGENALHFKEITEIRDYNRALHKFGLQLIGHEQHTESDNWTHSHWFQFEAGVKGLDLPELWGAMAHSFNKIGDPSAALLSKKISFTLRASGLRFRDCSRDYANQNLYAVRKKITPTTQYSNIDIFELYASLHSLLTEMGTLRDYLAQFISTNIFKHPSPVDSMRDLIAKLKKDGVGKQHAFAVHILEICDRKSKNGWLARVSEYRNIIAHRAPISHITKNSRLTVKIVTIGDTELLKIELGVPIDPIKSIETDYIDALTHFTSLMTRLRQFARQVIAESGVTPKVMTITDADLRTAN